MSHYTHVIYLLQINEVPYVGQTGAYKNRKRQHLNALRRGDHPNPHIQNAYNKYGESSIKWTLLGKCSLNDADRLERQWVAHYDAYRNGFNRTEGGDLTYGVPVTWDDIEYPSISAAAESLGIDAMTLSWRLEQGYTCDDDLQGRGSAYAISVTWEGIDYKSVSELSREIDVPLTTLRSWLDKGYTRFSDVNDIVGRPPKPVYWNGQLYDSAQHAADDNNMTLGTMYSHLNDGKISNREIRKRGTWSQRKIVWNDKIYESMKACCKSIGVHRSTLRKWLKNGYATDEDVKRNRWQRKGKRQGK